MKIIENNFLYIFWGCTLAVFGNERRLDQVELRVVFFQVGAIIYQVFEA